MKGLKRKFIVSLIAIMFAIVALGTSTYAYGSKIILTAKVTDSEVTIGEGRTATVTASLKEALSEGEVLVPDGQILNSLDPDNSVDSVTFEYDVIWEYNLSDKETPLTPLTVTITDLRLGGSDAYIGLVNTVIHIGSKVTENNASQDIEIGTTTVTITLTLTEPGSKEVYDAIVNKNITFNVTFTVAPDPAS